MMSRTDDPIADFNRYEDAIDRELAKLPKCSECDQPIQDENAYLINDEWICEDCMDNNHRVFVDDYVDSDDDCYFERKEDYYD